MLRWLKRLVLAVTIIGLLASNVLTLTSSAFNTLLSTAVAGGTGIVTLTQLNRQKLDRSRAAVKRMGTRLKARTVRMGSRSTLRSTMTLVPIAGAAAAIALTAWELTELCKGLKDLDRLYQDMEIEDEPVPIEVCRSAEDPR